MTLPMSFSNVNSSNLILAMPSVGKPGSSSSGYIIDADFEFNNNNNNKLN